MAQLGIAIERIKLGHPQRNGRHEPMHLTLKRETYRPPGSNGLQQQERFDAFVREFNTERPHEALEMKCLAKCDVAKIFETRIAPLLGVSKRSAERRASMQECSHAIDDTMGELVLVTPATAPAINFASVPDPSKAVTVTAVFTSKSKPVIMGSEGKIGGHTVSPLVETSEPIFQFGYGVLPFPMRRSYRITRLCSGATFEVTNVKPDGVSRICVHVVQLGRQSESR